MPNPPPQVDRTMKPARSSTFLRVLGLAGMAVAAALLSNVLASPARRLGWTGSAVPLSLPASPSILPREPGRFEPAVQEPRLDRPISPSRTTSPKVAPSPAPAARPVSETPAISPIREISSEEAWQAFQSGTPFLDARRARKIPSSSTAAVVTAGIPTFSPRSCWGKATSTCSFSGTASPPGQHRAVPSKRGGHEIPTAALAPPSQAQPGRENRPGSGLHRGGFAQDRRPARLRQSHLGLSAGAGQGSEPYGLGPAMAGVVLRPGALLGRLGPRRRGMGHAAAPGLQPGPFSQPGPPPSGGLRVLRCHRASDGL